MMIPSILLKCIIRIVFTEYYDVPAHIWKTLRYSCSKDQFLHQNIKEHYQ